MGTEPDRSHSLNVQCSDLHVQSGFGDCDAVTIRSVGCAVVDGEGKMLHTRSMTS